MKKYIALLGFLFAVTCASRAQQLPIKCGTGGDSGTDGKPICNVTYFERVENKIWTGIKNKPKVTFGSIKNIDYSNNH